MVNSKNGGKSVSASDLSALRPPKVVTSSTLKQAKESAIASKQRILNSRGQSVQYVVQGERRAPVGTTRVLSREEVDSLRETKRQVATHVSREFVGRKR